MCLVLANIQYFNWCVCVCTRTHACVCTLAQFLSRVWLFWTPWTVAHQASLSMGFFRQGYWSMLPFSLPRGLPTQGLNPCLCTAGVSFTSEPLGKPLLTSGPTQLQLSIVNEETALSLCANGLNVSLENPKEKNVRMLRIPECNRHYTWKKKVQRFPHTSNIHLENKMEQQIPFSVPTKDRKCLRRHLRKSWVTGRTLGISVMTVQ